MIGLYENAFADVPMKMKGNLDFTSGYFLSPLGAENKDIGAASLMLLTEIKLRLWCRLLNGRYNVGKVHLQVNPEIWIKLGWILA